MKVKFKRLITLLLVCVLMLMGCGKAKEDETKLEAAKEIYLNNEYSVEERIKALMSVMTLEEKVAQMIQAEQDSDCTPAKVTQYGIGSIFSGGGSAPSTGNSAKDWSKRINEYKEASLKSRLGIPIIYGVDAVHGHNNISDATIFPHNIGLGATGDEELVKRIGAIVAKEVRATGIEWNFAPMVGIAWNERWGRFYEGFGETSEIVVNMGRAYTEGFQGVLGTEEFLSEHKVIATLKHYVAEGQTVDGINRGNVVMEEEKFKSLLYSELLLPYIEGIEAGARSVMISFTSINGLKTHEDYKLITEVLKGELGFTGIVVSDYNGVHEVSGKTYKDKVKASVNAGIDVFMEPHDWKDCMDSIVALTKSGDVSMERIDDAVSRILRVKFELGMFDTSMEEFVANEEELLLEFRSKEHREVAKEAVRKSLVLLKNNTLISGNTALEALAQAEHILVAGSKANDLGSQCGGWTISWQGATGNITAGTTILEGIEKMLTAQGKIVTYNEDGNVTKGQNAVIVCLGEFPYAEWEGDKAASELTLSDKDKKVIENIKNSAKEVGNEDLLIIGVLITGRPLTITNHLDNFDAIVEAWLPGTEGDGIAEVLFGDYDFTGTLPVSWPWYGEDIPVKLTDESKVLFPIGYGLKKDGSSIRPEVPNVIGE